MAKRERDNQTTVTEFILLGFKLGRKHLLGVGRLGQCTDSTLPTPPWETGSWESGVLCQSELVKIAPSIT